MTPALLLAGARTAEVGWVTVADIDLDAGSAYVHGSVKYANRTVTLRRQDLPWFRARVAHLNGHDAALLCGPIGGTAANRQSTIGMTVGAVLTTAGLANDPAVTPTSLTAFAGHYAFERTGQIEAAARVTGCRSLDAAATLVNHRWQDGTNG